MSVNADREAAGLNHEAAGVGQQHGDAWSAQGLKMASASAQDHFESHGAYCFCCQFDVRQRIVMRRRCCALLGGMETAMKAFSCPMCLRALKISTIEPHPTRDRVDVVTYGCPIDGDIWRSVVVNRTEADDTEIPALLPS